MVKNQHENKISVANMKMFVGCVIGLEIIGLEITTLQRVEVALIIDKIVETRLRWFEHVEKRYEHSIVKRVDRINHSQINRDTDGFKLRNIQRFLSKK